MFQPSMDGKYHKTVHLQQMEKCNVQEYLTHEAQVFAQFILASRGRAKAFHKEKSNLVMYSIANGLKKLGGRAFNSAYTKMEQLHERDCFKPIDMRTMAQSERKKAMELLIFLLLGETGSRRTSQTLIILIN